jgi:esterase/lipase superfamily enzyme
VKNLALVAPDVEFELFRSQVKEMGARRPRIGVFLSQDDIALKVSKSIWGGSTRLGDINPEEEPFKSEIVQEKILVFDLTRLAGEDPHSRAFDEVSSVMGMLERRLAQGQQLGDDTSKAAPAR